MNKRCFMNSKRNNIGNLQHSLALQPSIPSPWLYHSLLPDRMQGSVLGWRLTFPQVGFAPTGYCAFFSALPFFFSRF